MISRLPRSLLPRQAYAFTPLSRRRSCTSSTADQFSCADEGPSNPPFTFEEERLGLPASEGRGYFQGGPGLSLGPSNRFKIQAKLGFGTTSSVWLAHDSVEETHVAIKILNGFSTQLNREHKLRELEVLQRLSSATQPSSVANHCRSLLAHFIHPGIEEEDGEHLCLVTDLSWCTFYDLKKLLEDGLAPIPVVKRMLTHVLLGLARLHSCGIAHTDIKPDNIMIDLGPRWTTDAINKWVLKNPPSTYPPERSLHKMVSVYRSQSFPLPTVDELSSCNFKIADFSSAQFVDDQTTDKITPFDLRSPELILGGEWNESVDIWTLGCIVFNLLTDQRLFNPEAFEAMNASQTDVFLYHMIAISGEFFEPELLQRCTRSSEYFNLDCGLKKFQRYVREPVDQIISDSGHALSPADLAGATDFIGKCLRLDPKNRATAAELLEHPWLIQ